MAADLVVGVVDCALGVDRAATGSAFAVGNIFRVGGFLRVVAPASALTADLKADNELIVEPEEEEETEDDEFVRCVLFLGTIIRSGIDVSLESLGAASSTIAEDESPLSPATRGFVLSSGVDVFRVPFCCCFSVVQSLSCNVGAG